MRALFFIVLTLIFLVGCSSNSGVVGGESFTQEGPVLVDATLSFEIIDGKPRGVTDYFYFDDTVNVYTLWQNVDDTQEVFFYFVSPSQDVEDSFATYLYPGEFSSAFVSYVPRNLEGDWEVVIYLGNDFQRSLLFYLSQSQGK